MSTSRIVKLNPGDTLTLMVESAAEVEGQYGKQVKLEGQTAENEDVCVFLPLDSAVRQLERSGLAIASAVGEVLKVEKVSKDGRTFININRAAGSPTNGKGKVAKTDAPGEREWKAPASAADALPWEKEEQDKLFTHYEKCFRKAVALAGTCGATLTLEGVSSIAATLFIGTKSAA